LRIYKYTWGTLQKYRWEHYKNTDGTAQKYRWGLYKNSDERARTLQKYRWGLYKNTNAIDFSGSTYILIMSVAMDSGHCP